VDLVALSPHLDDAVLSCGARIAATTARGGRALLVTFFTGAPEAAEIPGSHAKFADFAERKAEDAAAAGVLGADVRWLDLLERAYRPPQLRRPSKAFRSPSVTPRAFDNLEELERLIVQHLEEFPGAEVLAPLAVGNHVDHVVVFVAAVRVLVSRPTEGQLSFYEDAYAIGDRMRRQHFVTRRRPWRRGEAPEGFSLRIRALFTLLSWMRRGPPVEHHLPSVARALDWRSEVLGVEPFEAQKLDAVAAYRSQIELLGGAKAWGALLRRYHRNWRGEPIWRAATRPKTDEGEASR
jgi:LmbE family N-acetylglucosaminyl deacetylase